VSRIEGSEDLAKAKTPTVDPSYLEQATRPIERLKFMPLISRRTFGKNLAASLGLAFFNPSQLVHSQLFGLFRSKGHETPQLPPMKIFM